ncbi:polyprenyl diphosphate synthase [Streptomyces sp. NPDC059063]|uniref:polyprenyl diphosphate synthase n=1 Tax=unclassified Streptomyces TaxID=2593676 RepID=UPI00367BF718
MEATLGRLAQRGKWRIELIGRLDLLPAHTAAALQHAAERTAALAGPMVNIAVAYDGRREIVDALREVLSTPQGLAQAQAGLSEEVLASHLYTRGQPDPELIIRTSGEQRLSGFLPWQSAYSELYFSDVPWPAFTQADFGRALASFATRSRRYGS